MLEGFLLVYRFCGFYNEVNTETNHLELGLMTLGVKKIPTNGFHLYGNLHYLRLSKHAVPPSAHVFQKSHFPQFKWPLLDKTR